MHDLKTQLGDYLDTVVRTVDLEDLHERVETSLPVEPIVLSKPLSRRPSWAYAVAAAAMVLLVVGGATWLSRSSNAPPSETPTTPATSSVTPDPESPSEFDVESIPLPVVAEALTPSSIGVASWTVYDGAWTSDMEAGFDSVPGSSTAEKSRLRTPKLPESIFNADGIAVDVSANFLGGTEELALHDWLFLVDWAETAALRGDETLQASQRDGRIGAVVYREIEEVDILLFASRDERSNYLDSSRFSSGGLPTDTTTPFEVVAQYQLVTSEDDGRWTLEALDRVSGDRIGLITSVVPFVDGQPAEGVMTVTTGESVAIAEPEWLAEAVRNGSNWVHVDLDDSLLLYVEGDRLTYDAWRSTNGTEWENLGSPFPEGYRLEEIVGNADAGWSAYLDDDTESNAPGPQSVVAFSADGLNWSINDALPESCVSFYYLTAGWVCTSEPDEFILELWTSPDGLTWDEVDTTSLPSPADLGGTGFSSTQQQIGDDAIVMRVTADAGKTVTWVIQFA